MTKKDDDTEEQADDQAEEAPASPVIPGTTAGEVDPNATANAVASDIAKAENPENETDPIEGEAAPEPLPKAKRGHVYVRNIGDADVVDHGDQKFRRGEWVEVRKGVAMELLTFPNQRFEAMEEAEGDDG